MKDDGTAAAFGLFNMAFAELDQYVTIALEQFRRHNDPSASFQTLHGRGFKKNCEALKGELKQFDGKSSVEFELERLRDALRRAVEVNEWRRARVHCLVRRSDGGLALYDWKTHQRLSISAEECQEYIRELNSIVVEIQMSGLHLSNHLDWEKQFDEWWSRNIG